jgi:hypothetical protein
MKKPFSIHSVSNTSLSMHPFDLRTTNLHIILPKENKKTKLN